MANRPKPTRSVFKKYDDTKHWGVFIPVGREVVKSLYDPAYDVMKPPAGVRMHWCLTIKLFRCALRICEIRVRIGFQYL